MMMMIMLLAIRKASFATAIKQKLNKIESLFKAVKCECGDEFLKVLHQALLSICQIFKFFSKSLKNKIFCLYKKCSLATRFVLYRFSN